LPNHVDWGSLIITETVTVYPNVSYGIYKNSLNGNSSIKKTSSIV